MVPIEVDFDYCLLDYKVNSKTLAQLISCVTTKKSKGGAGTKMTKEYCDILQPLLNDTEIKHYIMSYYRNYTAQTGTEPTQLTLNGVVCPYDLNEAKTEPTPAMITKYRKLIINYRYACYSSAFKGQKDLYYCNYRFNTINN
jgi:hypothetical protein